MTGPEHYREAEKLLDKAAQTHNLEEVQQFWQAAQVHATLALAAATALNDGQYGMEHKRATKWEAVTT